MSWESPPQASARDRIDMTASTAYDDSGVVEYRFECLSGPAGCTAGSWQAGTGYSATGLLPGNTYEFHVTARDAFLNTTAPAVAASATTAANLSPQAVSDEAQVEEDASVVIAVLANDTDPEGDALTISGITQGAHGAVTSDGTHLTYTPDTGYTGGDSFDYTIDDGYGGTAAAGVTVTVNAKNHAPVANPDSVSISKGDTVVIPVLGNDSDPDGDALTITAVTAANKGTVTWQPGQDTISYAHNPKRKGSDGFSYTIGDGRGGQATATVSISLGGGDSGGGDSGTGTGGNGGGKGNGKGGGKTR
jgi:hypothetical protein